MFPEIELTTPQMLDVVDVTTISYNNLTQTISADFNPKTTKGVARRWRRNNALGYLFFRLELLGAPSEGKQNILYAAHSADRLFRMLEEQRTAIENLARLSEIEPAPNAAMVADWKAKAKAKYVMFYSAVGRSLTRLQKDSDPIADVSGVPVISHRTIHLENLNRLLQRQLDNLELDESKNAAAFEEPEEFDDTGYAKGR